MNTTIERQWRELVKVHGRTKAAEIINQSIQKSSEYKRWKKMMDEKHGGNNVSKISK